MPDENDQVDLDNLPDDANIAQVRGALDRERERRRAAEASAAQAEAMRRENAMLRAGVDSSHPAFSYFNVGYQGELEPEAINAEWRKIVPNSTTPPPPSEETPPPANDASGLTPEQQEELRRARNALNSDTTPPGAEPLKPLGLDVMDAAFEAQSPGGGVRARPTQGMSDKALNAGFSRIWERAVKNDDPEAVFKRQNESWADATDRWRRSQS